MTLAAAGGPSWTDILTAIGTVGAVIAALGIALYTDWRAGNRIKAEHDRADRQIREERQLALEREQFAEAYAVLVLSAERSIRTELDAEGRAGAVHQLGVILVNRSSYTVTRVEAQFYTGSSLVTHRKVTRLAGFAQLPGDLRAGWYASDERVTTDVLTPWDAGMSFESGEIHTQNLRGPYPIVRWTDRWGTRWEHKRGVVRQIRDGELWAP
jgi:hypothetical protein